MTPNRERCDEPIDFKTTIENLNKDYPLRFNASWTQVINGNLPKWLQVFEDEEIMIIEYEWFQEMFQLHIAMDTK